MKTLLIFIIIFFVLMIIGCIRANFTPPYELNIKPTTPSPEKINMPGFELDKIYKDYIEAIKTLDDREIKAFTKFQNADEFERPILLEKWKRRFADNHILYNAIEKLIELESRMILPEVEDKEINSLIIKYNNQAKISDKMLVYDEMKKRVDELNEKNLELWKQSGKEKFEKTKSELKESAKNLVKTPAYVGLFLLGMMWDNGKKTKKRYY